MRKESKNRKVVYFDMDDVLADFTGASSAALRAEPGIAWPQCEFGFFENLEPIEGAIETVLEIDKLDDVLVLFLSKPSPRNLWCFTAKAQWIQKHFGQDYVERLVLSCYKELSIGDYLIDDHADTWADFTGELIHFKTEKFPNHKTVLEYLLPKLKN